MPVEIITSGENVDVGLLAETTPGTLEQAVYEIFQTTGAELDYPSNEAEDNTTGDHGGPLSKRTISRGGDANFPAHLRYDGNKALAEAAFRDDFATAVSIVGSSDIGIDTAGTHADGSTGLVITGGAGAFTDLVTYASATVKSPPARRRGLKQPLFPRPGRARPGASRAVGRPCLSISSPGSATGARRSSLAATARRG